MVRDACVAMEPGLGVYSSCLPLLLLQWAPGPLLVSPPVPPASLAFPLAVEAEWQ
jgi:hypothetical protein